MKIYLFLLSICSIISSKRIQLNNNVRLWSKPLPTYQHHNYFNRIYTMVFNTYLPYSFFYESSFDSSEVNSTDVTLTDQYKAFPYLISFPNTDTIPIDNLLIQISLNQLFIWDSGIAFGLHYTNESFSLIHQMYNKKMIDKLQFTFENIDNKGNLYVGDAPEINETFSYKGVEKVNESLPTWGFTMKRIKYKNESFIMEIPIIVHSVVSNIIQSEEVYELMKNIILKEEHEKGKCDEVVVSNYYSLRKLKCVLSKERLNERILFEFDNIILNLTIGALFNRDSYSLFISNSEPKPFYNFTGGILGYDFLNLFNYTIFDYEHKQISFITDQPYLYSNPNSTFINTNQLIAVLLLIVSTLCLISCIALIINKYTYNILAYTNN